MAKPTEFPLMKFECLKLLVHKAVSMLQKNVNLDEIATKSIIPIQQQSSKQDKFLVYDFFWHLQANKADNVPNALLADKLL